MSVFKASATISVMTLTSRVLGFVRDVLLAKFLGASALADAFFVALRLPNILRQLFAEGAFNVAFVPFLARKLDQTSKPEAEKFASAVFSSLMVLVVAITAVVLIFMQNIVLFIAPGFADNAATLAEATTLARITFPYFVFIVATSFMGGILNTLNRFAAFAFAPVLLNVSFILCLLLLPGSDFFEASPAYAAAVAVPLGGVLQVLLMVIATKRSGFKLKIRTPHPHADLKPLLSRVAPTFVGVGAQQINTFLTTILASLLVPGSISYLFYADRLSQLPLALIGIALATAMLPTLSRAFKNIPGERAQTLFGKGLSAAMALGFAAACGLAVLSHEVITVLFMRGAFDQHAADMTSLALKAFAVGLPAFILIKITSTAFYAREDTRTPVKTALVSIAINIGLMFLLMPYYGHVGLAAAAAGAGWCHLLLQIYLLSRHRVITRPFWRTFLPYTIKAAVVTFLMGVLVYTVKTAFPLPAGGLEQVLWLVALIGAGGLFWGGLGLVMGLHKPFLTFAPSPENPQNKKR